jgi:superfamily II DNA or RNA helicase
VLPEIPFTFKGQLKPFQEEAVDGMLRKDFGTLAAPTGSGKTVMALAMIAARSQPTLVIVHTKELVNQWIERISSFLSIPAAEIGIIGDGKKTIGEYITVGIVNSVYTMADAIKEQIGFLVVDECHHAPSRTFTEAVSAFDCRYMLGLSATPYRRDGLSKLIYWYLGDCHHKIEQGDLIKSGDILRVDIITRETNFIPAADPVEEYSQMLSELTEDEERNALIAADVVTEAKSRNGVCLVLSDRKEHCNALNALVSRYGVKTAGPYRGSNERRKEDHCGASQWR